MSADLSMMRNHSSSAPLRSRHIALLLLVLAITPADSFAQELVAIVDLEFVHDTGKAASAACSHAEGDDCSAYPNFYLWRATVRAVLSGEETEPHFLVLYGAHGLPRHDLRSQRLLMRRLASSDPMQPRYLVVDETGQ